MSTALMARRKRDPKTVAIAKAILEKYDCKKVEDMQDAMFMAKKTQKTAGMATATRR